MHWGGWGARPLRVALRKESVDRNNFDRGHSTCAVASLSVRRAWIEIPVGYRKPVQRRVALRKESVDRNIMYAGTGPAKCVALRKESVDRNDNGNAVAVSDLDVALRKESVDRNFHHNLNLPSKPSRSP